MTSRDFCFWLQGYFELTGGMPLNGVQVATVQNHLSLVFVHEIDPSMHAKPGDAEKLQAVHDGKLTLSQAAESLRQLLSLGFNDLTSCATLLKSSQVSTRLKSFLVGWYGFEGSSDDCAEVMYIKDVLSSLDNRIKQDQAIQAKKPVMRC